MKETWTPPRSVRIPDDVWTAAKTTAEQRGETITDVVLRALKSYSKRHAATCGVCAHNALELTETGVRCNACGRETQLR